MKRYYKILHNSFDLLSMYFGTCTSQSGVCSIIVRQNSLTVNSLPSSLKRATVVRIFFDEYVESASGSAASLTETTLKSFSVVFVGIGIGGEKKPGGGGGPPKD